MKKILFVSVATIAAMLMACAEPDVPEQEGEGDGNKTEQPADLDPLTVKVPVTENWIYDSTPYFTFNVENPNDAAMTADVTIRISTDRKKLVSVINYSEEVEAKAKKSINVDVTDELEPGFYRAVCFVNGKTARSFTFGVNPDQLVSAPDMQPDFEEFWNTAKEQLASIDMNATLTELPKKSSAARKVYLVEMQSVPDGLTGEPVTIRGYYVEPQDGEKHPVIIHFFGYDTQNSTSKPTCPSGGSSDTYAEFYLSTRGQILNNRDAAHREPDGKGDNKNIYGDWFAYEFGNRDSYYYRGAFMDCVQAVRFMATRPTSDMNNLFAEGSSQGGAFSYAAAALSDYPFTAIAPCVAFLGDFPDYFNIVSWPGDTARNNQGSMTDEEMFAFLSYFDTKNLATRILCPVIACSGLQDGTCPPHTNLAPFNNLSNEDKQMYYYPEMKHEIPSGWSKKYGDFFEAHITTAAE